MQKALMLPTSKEKLILPSQLAIFNVLLQEIVHSCT